MLGQLRANGFKGKVKIATFVGEFCLTGNGIEGYSMATDDLPMKRCDLVGNPFEDSLPSAQRQSLAFANLLSSLRPDGGLTVEVAHEGRRPSVPYPTAGPARARHRRRVESHRRPEQSGGIRNSTGRFMSCSPRHGRC